MLTMLAIAALLLAGQTVPAPAAQPVNAFCSVSDDPSYGFTRENPVQIGGGALYMKARETRYLEALRGPDGQPIRYRRTGSLPQNPQEPRVILDAYEVTYDGLEKPLTLYLNAYHYWKQDAPKGLTCGQAMQLQPLLDEFLATENLRMLALEQGATRQFDPIPLGMNNSATHGVIFDAFRVIGLVARAAAAAGSTLAPTALGQRGTTVLAFPVRCGDKRVLPSSIDILPAQGQAVSRLGDLAKAAAISTVLPGIAAPAEGSIAATFPLLQVRPGDRIRIAYDGPDCTDGVPEITFPISLRPSRAGTMQEVALPEGVTVREKRVLLQAIVDLDGAFRRVSYAGGPSQLTGAAIEAVNAWKAEPASVNGTPVVWSTLLEVRFK
jgi:hypothetical protein